MIFPQLNSNSLLRSQRDKHILINLVISYSRHEQARKKLPLYNKESG